MRLYLKGSEAKEKLTSFANKMSDGKRPLQNQETRKASLIPKDQPSSRKHQRKVGAPVRFSPSAEQSQNQESRKATSFPKDQPSSRKHQRKAGTPVRFSPTAEQSQDVLVCRNPTCRASLSPDVIFCKRCCCSICHSFDDNKDPSLWLVCAPESGSRNACGLACHIECALLHERVGVVAPGKLMQLDGSYHCASCGEVTGILGCWKKQLTIAKDAERVDTLRFRISLSYKLLDGTSRFSELHELVRDAKAKLEAGAGLVEETEMARGTVSRLCCAGEVQKLISLAIEKADKWLAAVSNSSQKCTGGSFPAACVIHFEEVTASSLFIVLDDFPGASTDDVKGYRLWYSKCSDQTHPKEPMYVISRSERKIFIPNLQPSTEYFFQVVSYTDSGNFGYSVAKCFTKSVGIILESSISSNHNDENPRNKECSPMITVPVGSSSGLGVQDPGKVISLHRAQEKCFGKGVPGVQMKESCEFRSTERPEMTENQPWHLGIDLNIASVPGLNDELISPESFGLKDNVGPSTDEFELFVKTIRSLESKGYIEQQFRLKTLTWFINRATEHQRRVVRTFIQTMLDDPSSLAEQLVDTFSDTIYSKMPRSEPR